MHFLTQIHSCTQIDDTPPLQLILITRGNVVIGASCQLECTSNLSGGFGYTAASQTPHSQETSTPASVSRTNMFHKYVAQGGRRAFVGGVWCFSLTKTIIKTSHCDTVDTSL